MNTELKTKPDILRGDLLHNQMLYSSKIMQLVNAAKSHYQETPEFDIKRFIAALILNYMEDGMNSFVAFPTLEDLVNRHDIFYHELALKERLWILIYVLRISKDLFIDTHMKIEKILLDLIESIDWSDITEINKFSENYRPSIVNISTLLDYTTSKYGLSTFYSIKQYLNFRYSLDKPVV